MEHVQDGAGSVGAMLSEIAESLREVSRKLDLVATRVEVPLPVPLPADERDLATRLAALEAWAFRTDSDVAEHGRRLDLLQQAAGAPATGRRHAADADDEGRRAEAPAPPLGRRAARRLGISGDADGADGEGAPGEEPAAVPRRLVSRTGGAGAHSATDADGSHQGAPVREPSEPDRGNDARQAGVSGGSHASGAEEADGSGDRTGTESPDTPSGSAAAPRTSPDTSDAAVPPASAPPAPVAVAAPPDPAFPDASPAALAAAFPGESPEAPSSLATAAPDAAPPADVPAGPGDRAALANGTGRRTRADRNHASPVSGDWVTPAKPRHDAAADPAAPNPAPASAALPARAPGAPEPESGEAAAPARPPRPRYAAGSARQRIAEARAESAGRHAPEEPARPVGEAAPAEGDDPAGLRAAVEARRASGRLPQRGAPDAPPRPSGLPQRTPAEQAPPVTPTVSVPEEPRTGLTRPSETDYLSAAADSWNAPEPHRNGSNGSNGTAPRPAGDPAAAARPPLNLGETMAAAYDQGLREAFTGGEPPSGLPTRTPGSAARDEGFRQTPAAYPLNEAPGDLPAPASDGFSAFADHTRGTDQPQRPGWTASPAEPVYGPDAARAEDPHQDKLQAMLDELKRTAAATPDSRPDVFGPPTGESPGR